MSQNPRRAHRRTALLALATAGAIAVPLGAAMPGQAASGASDVAGAAANPGAKLTNPGSYIVQMAGNPLATYAGTERGYARTMASDDGKLNVRTSAAKAYAAHLATSHDGMLKRIGVSPSKKTHDYSVSFNGFAAKLTAAEAATLRKTPGVVNVWADETRVGDTVSTPKFLGLDGPGGAWIKQFGNPDKAGEGIIIGDIDSGFWPENPSLAALPEPRPDAAAIAGKWHGSCNVGAEQPITCNNKVIGAQYWANPTYMKDYEFESPRDFNGHGTHTATTAAGLHGIPASINGQLIGDASGMAPAARIAVYKVLWSQPDHTTLGATSDIVSAIDMAVSDGVDVINFSISGSRNSVVSPDEVAFYGAAAAGVFVAAAAGNDGDKIGVSSVNHNAPWEMTVAASTHDRGSAKKVVLGNGATYTGVGVGGAVGPAPLINSEQVGATGVPAQQVSECWPNSLDASKVAGKIVLCARGTVDRVVKSQVVQAAGGIGMILRNTTDVQSLNGDFHVIPTSHVTAADGTAILNYITSTSSPTATLQASTAVTLRAPEMASFSSYGPAIAGGGDLLKPDITAPGVDVIAGVSPAGDSGGNNYNALSGTSMATPHIAGIAALIKQKHPKWGPMVIKSALMTTATNLDNQGLPIQRAGHDATPLDFGAGHVQPGSAFNPGLVYDSRPEQWLKYLCSIGQAQWLDPALCTSFGETDPSNFNSPSIAIGQLAGKQTVTRTVLNVDKTKSTYTPTIVAPPGTTVTVKQPSLTVAPNTALRYQLTVTRTTAALDAWTFGSITWKDAKGHAVRIPIAVKPVALGVAATASGTGTTGSTDIAVTPGYDGVLNASVTGLVPADVKTITAAINQSGTATVDVPAGTNRLRVATYDADYPAGTDIDLALLNSQGQVMYTSAGPTAEEWVELYFPAAGTYTVKATYFAGATPTLDQKVNTFVLPSADLGNTTVTPATQPATLGKATKVTASWTGLNSGTRYWGSIDFSDGTNSLARTFLTVTP